MLSWVVASVLLSSAWAAEKCCTGVGCFTDAYPFDSMPLPNCLNDIQPDMTLYTRSNRQDGLVINPNTIPWSFSSSKRTVFLVHGFIQGSFVTWINKMKDAYLDAYDYNVIIVGWFRGALELWYPQAASNTRVVGREIGNVARNLVEKGGTKASNIWCVGHSLGSHVCGHAGSWYKIGRITGMDPAGPSFQTKDWSVGLNPSCANYVDVIHTHGTADLIIGLGTLKPLGHVDLYPNGGQDQPGCILDPRSSRSLPGDAPGELVDLTPACSHLRILDYWTEAVLANINGCHFYSRDVCYDEYNIPGACLNAGEIVQEQGPGSENYSMRGLFYYRTNSKAPFCRN